MPRGSKWWAVSVIASSIPERMISLGVYPGVNLATARLLQRRCPAGSSHGTSIPVPIVKRAYSERAYVSNLLHASGLNSCSRASRKVQLAADTVKDATRNPGARHLSGPGDSRNLRHQSAPAPHGAQEDRAQGPCGYTARRAKATLQPRVPTRHRHCAMSSGRSRTICAVFLSLRTFATDQGSPIPGRLGRIACARPTDTPAGEVIGIALKLALLFFVRPGELRKGALAAI